MGKPLPISKASISHPVEPSHPHLRMFSQIAGEARETDLMLLKIFKSQEAADVVRQLMGVEEHWLQTAFDAIDEDYGSFENYLMQGLGLGDEDIAQLRAQLLE